MSEERVNEERAPRSEGDRPQITWTEAVKITMESVVVAISKSSHWIPRYSIRIGRERQDGSIAAFLQPRTFKQYDGSCEVDATFEQIQEALYRAKQWIMDDLASAPTPRPPREEKKGNGNSRPVEVQRPGKTARQKAKLAAKKVGG